MVIDKRLHKTSYTGKYVRCRTFSGRVERFPQCCMTIHTLYYIGLVDICVLRKPLAQILIVQLKGVKRCTNQEIKAWQRWNGLESRIIFTLRGNKIHTHSSDIDSIEANVVTTRGATRKHQQRLQQEQNERITSSPQNTRETSSKFSQPVKFSGIEEMDDRPQNAIPEGSQSTISARDIHLEIFTTISDNSQKVNTRNQKRVRNQWIWFPRGKTAKKNFPVEQRDTSLRSYVWKEAKGDLYTLENGKWQLYLKDIILFRYFVLPIPSLKQLVVPTKFRQVLQMGHDSMFTGHLSRIKTLAHI